MNTMVSQITSPTVVYSAVYSAAYQRKHKSSASLAFVRGIPAQRASNAENVSIWWRHHEDIDSPSTAAFELRDTEICDCPTPCQRKMYEAKISYAETSKFDTRRHQRAADTVLLQAKFHKALETAQRVDEVIVARDRELVANLHMAALQVTKKLLQWRHTGVMSSQINAKWPFLRQFIEA